MTFNLGWPWKVKLAKIGFNGLYLQENVIESHSHVTNGSLSSLTPFLRIWPLTFQGHTISFLRISRKILEIRAWLLLWTYKKSYMSFHFMPWPMTLDDFERSNSLKIRVNCLYLHEKVIESTFMLIKVSSHHQRHITNITFEVSFHTIWFSKISWKM